MINEQENLIEYSPPVDAISVQAVGKESLYRRYMSTLYVWIAESEHTLWEKG